MKKVMMMIALLAIPFAMGKRSLEEPDLQHDGAGRYSVTQL